MTKARHPENLQRRRRYQIHYDDGDYRETLIGRFVGLDVAEVGTEYQDRLILELQVEHKGRVGSMFLAWRWITSIDAVFD